MKIKTTFIFFVFFLVSATCQDNQDSILIEKGFGEIIKEPHKLDSFLVTLESKVNLKNDTTADVFDFSKAKFHYRLGQFDEAFEIIDKRVNSSYNKSINDGKYYNLRGAIYSLKSENDKAVAEFVKSSKNYEKQGNELRAALIKNNIANIYFSLNDHLRAYKYISECYEVLKNHQENSYYPSILGVYAISVTQMDSLSRAEKISNEGLSIAHERKDSVALAILNYAKGELSLKTNDLELAENYLQIALTISQNFNLQQYVVMTEILLMELSIKKEEFQKAINFGLSALNNSENQSNKTTLIAIHKGLHKAYLAIENFEKAYIHLSKLNQLNEVIRNDIIRGHTDSLLIAFESEKKDFKIKKNELELAKKEERIEKQRVYLTLSITGLILLSVILVLFFRLKKSREVRTALEADKAILNAILKGEEKERARIASELHDGLAAELMALKLTLEQDEPSSKYAVKAQELQSEVRKISHQLAPSKIEDNGFLYSLKSFLNQIEVKDLEVDYFTNFEDESFLSLKEKSVIFRVVQELIQNALKHADASYLAVQVLMSKDGKLLTLSVEDNGKGISQDMKAVNANGKKRIQLINGELEYESEEGKGTLVTIKLRIN